MTSLERAELDSLLVRFADGDRSAFAPLFERLWPATLAVARRITSNEADAEDAAQQAVLKIFDSIADLDPARNAVAWALSIATYEALTVRRRRQRRGEIASVAEDDRRDERPLADDQVIEAEARTALFEMVGGMSELDRAALAHFWTGEAPPTDETSRKRRLRAVDRLRAAWRRL